MLLADEPLTPAIQGAMTEVARRRRRQHQHNVLHGITPRNALAASPSPSLGLFEVMAEQIAAAPRGARAATAAHEADAAAAAATAAAGAASASSSRIPGAGAKPTQEEAGFHAHARPLFSST